MGDPVGVDGAALTALLVDGLDESAILTLDVEGHVVTWNAGALRMHRYAAEEIIGRHFSVLHPVETISAGRPDALMAAARSAGQAEARAWRVRKDGTRFWASVVMAAITSAVVRRA